MQERTLDATIENIEAVTDFVNAQLEALDCPKKALRQIDIAIDELFGNIARYAYRPDVGPVTVRVEVEKEPLSVILTFIDHGVPFDPLQTENPDITIDAQMREPGGAWLIYRQAQHGRDHLHPRKRTEYFARQEKHGVNTKESRPIGRLFLCLSVRIIALARARGAYFFAGTGQQTKLPCRRCPRSCNTIQREGRAPKRLHTGR